MAGDTAQAARAVLDVGRRRERLRAVLPEDFGKCIPLWIDGAWQPGATGESLPCIDPTVGETLIDFTAAGEDDLERAVAAARRAQPLWWAMDGQDRARILRRIADAIRGAATMLGTLDTLDAGRPIRDTISRDVERAARIFEFFAGTTDRLRGAVVPAQPGRTNLLEWEPIGIVGGITPWNYPLTNAVGKVAPALATGNAIILKPAEESPLSALMLGFIAHQAGLPAGLLNVLSGPGPAIGGAVVAHAAIGKINFTGSTEVGRHIGETAGRLLKSVTLELGGKTGFIVCADADLARAADALVFSAFNNAGQTCTAGSRLLVDRAIAAPFSELVATRIARIRIGDPLDPETRLGPAISARHRDGVLARIAAAEADGLTRLDVAGLAVPASGYFIKPVMFSGVDPGLAIAQQEVFGPVVTVSAFSGDDEAIAMANGTPYGLATTVWTRDIGRARKLARQAQSGIVWINTVHSLHPGSAYGGYKQSGVGHEMGAEAVAQHMKLKSVWIEEQPWQSPWNLP